MPTDSQTKKFKNFNYNILEGLFLLEKLRYVRSFMKIPKKITKNIDKINTLRNGLAHAFFPENLKRSKPIYKGKSIFTLQGIQQLGRHGGNIGLFCRCLIK